MKINHNKNKKKVDINMLKKFLKFIGMILLFFVIIFDFMFLTELKKAGGSPTKAAVRHFEKCCK